MSIAEEIFRATDTTFEKIALEVFGYQYEQVEVYRSFCQSLKKHPENVKSIYEIPFLRVEFFKTHKIIASGKEAVKIFESSGTTGIVPSRHYVADISLYEKSFLSAFKRFYGNPDEIVILALLPSYLERGNSSLIYMADVLIRLSQKAESGFFLDNYSVLQDVLLRLQEKKQKVILLGVTYALLDFAEIFQCPYPELIVMETGGMKGRREELTREEVHLKLCSSFGVSKIHSEYGMTELLSQAYSTGDGIFGSPPWMKVLARDIYDPMKFLEAGQTGAANIIDLANIFSCSFIATNDLTRIDDKVNFEILGRVDNAEIRGCNLMVME